MGEKILRGLKNRGIVLSICFWYPCDMKERGSGLDIGQEPIETPRVVHLRGGVMTVWRPLISIGNLNIVEYPSRGYRGMIVLGKEIPGSQIVSRSIIFLKNTADRFRKS